MGKTADGAVWLNADLLSPFEYWQFWRNTAGALGLPLGRLASPRAVPSAPRRSPHAARPTPLAPRRSSRAARRAPRLWRADADVGRFLKIFTELPREEIEALEALQGAEINKVPHPCPR